MVTPQVTALLDEWGRKYLGVTDAKLREAMLLLAATVDEQQRRIKELEDKVDQLHKKA